MQCMRMAASRGCGMARQLAILMVAVFLATPAYGQIVNKVVEDFTQSAWTPSPWNSATGQTSLVSEAAADGKIGRQPEDGRRLLRQRFRGLFRRSPRAAVDSRQCQDRNAALQDQRQPLWPQVGLFRRLGPRPGQRRIPGMGHPHQSVGQLEDGDVQGAGRLGAARCGSPALRRTTGKPKDVKITVPIQIADIEVETDITDVDPKTGVLTTWTPEPNPAEPAQGLEAVPADAAGGRGYGQRAGVERLHAHGAGSEDPPAELEARRAQRQADLPACRRRGEIGRPVRAAGGRGEFDQPQLAAEGQAVRTLHARRQVDLVRRHRAGRDR